MGEEEQEEKEDGGGRKERKRKKGGRRVTNEVIHSAGRVLWKAVPGALFGQPRRVNRVMAVGL